MTTRIAAITGAVTGVGAELALLLPREGFARMALINRSRERTEPLLARLRAAWPLLAVEVIEADLSEQADVTKAAAQLAAFAPKLDLLVNNAAVLGERAAYNSAGIELHFAVNTLAPYILMRLLRPQLSAARPSVVINVSSSGARQAGKLDIEGLPRPERFRKLFGSYLQSKLALSLVTAELARDFFADGILLISVDPGPNRTAMTKSGGMPRWLRLLPLTFPGPRSGARRVLEAAISSTLRSTPGAFVDRLKVKSLPETSKVAALMQLVQASTGL